MDLQPEILHGFTCPICKKRFTNKMHHIALKAVKACKALGIPAQYFAEGTELMLHTKKGAAVKCKITKVKLVNTAKSQEVVGRHTYRYFVKNGESGLVTEYIQEKLMEQYGKGVFTKA